MNIGKGVQGGCDSLLEDMGLFDERKAWLDDKEAEYRMNGMSEKDAKEKAMSDWHIYKVPNV